MPDWKQAIRERVHVFRLCPATLADELVEEWASHLEDAHEGFLRDGMSSDDAYRRSLDEFHKLGGLKSTLRILREVLMRSFTKQVAVPGVMTFGLAGIMGAALDLANIRPRIIFFGDQLFFTLSVPLLCLLPLCSAAGAYVSHRNGGTPLHRIAAALFLPTIMSGLVVVMAIAGWAISRFVPDYGWNPALVVKGLALWFAGYALLPAIPLLLGSAAEVKWSAIRKRAA